MTYKCNVLFVPRAPVVLRERNHIGSPFFFHAHASVCARVHTYIYVCTCIHAVATHASLYIYRTRIYISVYPDTEPRLCGSLALLCVTRIIRERALAFGDRVFSARRADLDKSKIAVAEVRPCVPHLTAARRSISESRAALNLTVRSVAEYTHIYIQLFSEREVSHNSKLHRCPPIA